MTSNGSMSRRLETRRLLLTPETDDDAQWFAELLSARGQGAFSVEEARSRIAVMGATFQDLGIGALALRVLPGLEAIGYCALVVGRSSVEEPELAYELLPRAHGQGYATEAARAVLAAGFATGRRRIWSTVGTWNTASLRVLEKLGFVRDRVTPHESGAGDVVWLRREAP